MSKEMEDKTIAVTWEATEISAKTLQKLFEILIKNHQKLKTQVEHGEQSLKKLNLYNQKLESVDLNKKDLRAMRKEMNRYGVDFSVMKNKASDEYTIFFKGKDIERVKIGLENCVKKLNMKDAKKPIKKTMEQAAKESDARNQEKGNKEKTADREQSHER